jgi:hypothetical protein
MLEQLLELPNIIAGNPVYIGAASTAAVVLLWLMLRVLQGRDAPKASGAYEHPESSGEREE